MNNSKRKAWEQILQSSANMNEVAQRSDWQLLQKLALERKKLISDFFREPIAKDRNIDLDKIINDINLILKQDKLTVDANISSKKTVLASIKTINKGKTAAKEYR